MLTLSALLLIPALAAEPLADAPDVGRARTLLLLAGLLVAAARQLLVLDEGRIVERGTHAKLLAGGGRYTAMWAVQGWRIAA